MYEVIFSGPEGRLEGKFIRATRKDAPAALILHPHPKLKGTMNHRLCYDLHHLFVDRGFSALRFNFRGVGRSHGVFDNGPGELADAGAALDYLHTVLPSVPFVWVVGISFGAWIGMQILMRRPQIAGFCCVSVPANLYDFTFLAPCPSSGLILHGEQDRISPVEHVRNMVRETRTQRGRSITYEEIPDAGHFFKNRESDMLQHAEAYLDMRLSTHPAGPTILE